MLPYSMMNSLKKWYDVWKGVSEGQLFFEMLVLLSCLFVMTKIMKIIDFEVALKINHAILRYLSIIKTFIFVASIIREIIEGFKNS